MHWRKGEVEKAKRDLSSVIQTKIEIENLVEGVDFRKTQIRDKLEELGADLLKKNLDPIEKSLKDVEKKTTDIDEIVLVYRSSKFSKMRQLIKDFFNDEKSIRDVNLDEVVIYGTIVRAGILWEEATEETKGMLIIDVSSLILWIETAWNPMKMIIIKN